MTVRHTDRYLQKSFRRIQDTLDPDTVLFLGDLFDGGREWSTAPGASEEAESVDKRWRKYGETFWLKEYIRFGRIFYDTWIQGSQRPYRKIIASLPGNHDLGLGMGIRVPVRKRFNTYFGSGNRIDFIGNHSFVSLDTVSLSAKGQPNTPPTNGEGAESQAHSAEDIWAPTEVFLFNAKAKKGRVIEQQLRLRSGGSENELQDLEVLDVPSSRIPQILKQRPDYTDIPSIVLTHVPLFRSSGTPCGPLRERFPPSKRPTGNEEPLEKDERNAISVAAGIQYQNVLTPEVSKEIIEYVGDVEYIFSGDDHDYCEVVHRGYSSRMGGVREITVKSMSWAMGIRKPGFLMLSLWNPLDAEGRSLGASVSHASASTIRTQLCLLPDQLGILARYGLLLGGTLFVMFLRACINVSRSNSMYGDTNRQLLPVSKFDADDEGTKATSDRPWFDSQSENSSSNATEGSTQSRLAARSKASRSSSPFDGYAVPTSRTRAGSMQQRFPSSNIGIAGDSTDEDTVDPHHRTTRHKPEGVMATIFRTFFKSVLQIASVAILWYMWLLI